VDFKGLLNAICDDGETEVRIAYPDQSDKLEGALQGFAEARMTLDPNDLKSLYETAMRDVTDARERKDKRYWYWRYRSLQLEWCLNVIAAAQYNQGLPTIITPTYRGLRKAADILGVA
jgi:hypothetical protein